MVWLCVLLLFGLIIFVGFPAYCCWFDGCIGVGFLSVIVIVWPCVSLLFGLYFCWLPNVFFLVGRVYCCWLVVCIVIGWLCVFLLIGLCVVLGCPCVILLFGRMNFCWFSVRNIYCFDVGIVVDSLCVIVNRWFCLSLLVVLFIVYLLDVCICVGWPCIFFKFGGFYCCYLAVLIVVGCVYCVVWAANCLRLGGLLFGFVHCCWSSCVMLLVCRVFCLLAICIVVVLPVYFLMFVCVYCCLLACVLLLFGRVFLLVSLSIDVCWPCVILLVGRVYYCCLALCNFVGWPC